MDKHDVVFEEPVVPETVAGRDRAVDGLREALHALVRDSGLTQRAIERDNDFARGYLSQVLNAHVALTVRHVFGVLLTLGVPPGRFIADFFAEPEETGPEGEMSEIRQRLDRYDSLLKQLEEKGLVTPEE